MNVKILKGYGGYCVLSEIIPGVWIGADNPDMQFDVEDKAIEAAKAIEYCPQLQVFYETPQSE